MTVRLLLDEDLRVDIIQSLRFREPAIDILDVKTSGLRGTKDPVLLELAAQQGRIMVWHDCKTMIQHYCERIHAGKPALGLFIVPQRRGAIGAIIDSLLMVWAASQAEEWHGRIVYLPSALNLV